MIQLRTLIMFLTNFIFFHEIHTGFAAGTMVKVPNGYELIECLKLGSLVCSVTADGNAKLSRVQSITSYFLRRGIVFVFENDFIVAAPQQKYFLPLSDQWKKSKKIELTDLLLSGTNQTQKIEDIVVLNQEIEFFDIRLDGVHTFCVSTHDIVVHNFPLCFVGFSIAWGLGSVTFEGLYCGICLAGFWLGTKLLKGGQHNSGGKKWKIQPIISGGSPGPDDDDEWQKKHPHGRYVESPKHHQNARGNVGKPPRDGQTALDSSLEVAEKYYRIAVQDGEIIRLMKDGPNTYHGYIVENWNEVKQVARDALKAAGYRINQRTGKWLK